MNGSIHTNQHTWAEEVVEGYKAKAHVCSALLVSDIDDTLLDGDKRWHELYLEYAHKQGLEKAQIASLEEFRGRPRQYFSGVVEDYDSLKKELMADVDFNAGMDSLASSPGLAKLSPQGYPNGYLTTRRAVLAEVTAQNLSDEGFSSAPILFRPETVDYEGTTEYKIAALRSLGEAARSAGVEAEIYYVDDFKELVANINKLGFGVTALEFDKKFSWEALIGSLAK